MSLATIALVVFVGIVFVIALILVRIDINRERELDKAYLEALNKLKKEYERSIEISAKWEELQERIN